MNVLVAGQRGLERYLERARQPVFVRVVRVGRREPEEEDADDTLG